jgi:hypothetical protein
MATPGTYQWKQDQVTAALAARLGRDPLGNADFSIEEMDDDHVVVRRWQENAWWRYPYTIDEAGNVDLGEPQEMEQVVVPITKQVEILVPVEKAGRPDKRFTLGVVLEPDREDLQGDILSADDIEKTAHDYMVRSRRAGELHQGPALKGAEVVESYIAPCDMVIQCTDGSTQTVRKGSWVMGTVWPQKQWDEIKKGKFTGYSIQGKGARIPLGQNPTPMGAGVDFTVEGGDD